MKSIRKIVPTMIQINQIRFFSFFINLYLLKLRMFWQNHFNEWIFLPGPKLLRFVSTNIFHFGAVGKTFCFSDYAIIVICNIHHRLQSANITKVSGSILVLKIQSCKMGSDITRRVRKHKIRLHKVFYVGDSEHLLIF